MASVTVERVDGKIDRLEQVVGVENEDKVLIVDTADGREIFYPHSAIIRSTLTK